MRNAVSDRHRQVRANLLAQEADQFSSAAGRVATSAAGQLSSISVSPVVPLATSRGLCPNSFYLTFEAPFQLIILSNSEQLKLDARATCIHH